jgi:iron complex outermembrane recepter protein
MRKILLILGTLMTYDEVVAQEKDSVKIFNDTTVLKEVTVQGKKPAVQILPDKIIINVEASVSNTGATVLEVLEKSPGITFDRNGGLSLKGRQGVTIMIDGKPSQVSGTDLNNLLSGMTSSQVETIEIIDNPSAKYDAAGNAGIINIKTKKNKQKGFNGNASFAFGQGRYSRSINTITINKYSGKINMFATLGVNELKNFSRIYALRKYYAEDNTTLLSMLEQPSYFAGKVPTQTLKTGVDYFINPKTTISAVVSGTLFMRGSTGNNIAEWMDAQGKTDSIIITDTRQKEKLRNGSININAKHTFNSSQELTIDLDALGYRINNDQGFSNHLEGPNGYTEYIQGYIPSKINILTGKADYTYRFANGLKLESGWKSSHVKTNNQGEYFYRNTGDWQPDYGKTNHFLYKENIHAIYSNAQKQIGKWILQAGLRYENTSYDANQLGNPVRKDSSFSRNYDGLFPSATASIEVDSLNSFTISAGRRIDRPPFQSLNPFVFVINKYTYQAGNPFYRPQYTWNTELTHSFKNILTTSISYSITNDYFSQIFTVDNEGIITYTEGNLDRMENYGISVSTQLSPASWWSISGQVNLNHKRIKGYVWENLEASLTQMNFNINNQFSFDKGWSAEISGFMQTREQELQEITDPTGQLIAGVSKQIFKNKGTLRFLVRDIFYTQAMQGNTIFKQATEYFKIQRDSRAASIAFTYRFGKSAQRATRRNSGGAEDEMKRVNTAG